MRAARPPLRLLLLCTVLLFDASGFAAELTAKDVMERVDDRYDGDSSISSWTMILIDRRERQRTRDMRIYQKDYTQDTKRLYLFESPADIRGTAFLNFDWNDLDRDDDSWLYLPSLQRVKRLATSDTSDSFLGSDFTYADFNGLQIEWYDYSFINDSEVVDGEDCWVIEVTAKPEFKDEAEDATGYSRAQFWVRKDIFVSVQAQAWELRGNRIKYFSSSEIELIDDIWTVQRLQAITTRNGRQEHASVLQLNNVEYNVDVDDALFTTENMQRGLD